MDSIERDQREKKHLGERGERLFDRKPKNEHKEDKAQKIKERKNIKGITK